MPPRDHAIGTFVLSAEDIPRQLFRDIAPVISEMDGILTDGKPRIVHRIRKTPQAFHRGRMIPEAGDAPELPASVILDEMLCHRIGPIMLFCDQARLSLGFKIQCQDGRCGLREQCIDFLPQLIVMEPVCCKQDPVQPVPAHKRVDILEALCVVITPAVRHGIEDTGINDDIHPKCCRLIVNALYEFIIQRIRNFRDHKPDPSQSVQVRTSFMSKTTSLFILYKIFDHLSNGRKGIIFDVKYHFNPVKFVV